MNQLLKRLPMKALLAVAGQFFASLTNFGTGVIVGRACGPADYGLYFLGFTILVFLLEIQNALISTPYTVYAPRKQGDEAAWYRGSALLNQAVLCAVVSVGFVLVAAAGEMGYGPAGMAPVFFMLSVASACFLLRDQARRLCFAHMRMGLALACDAAVAVLQLGGLLALAALGWMSSTVAYGVVAVACGVVAGAYLLLEAPNTRLSWRLSVASFAQHWAVGKWVVASAVLWGVSMNFYPWLINYYQNAEQAGIWAAAVTLVSLGNIFMMGVHNFLGPKIAAVYAESGPGALRKFVLEANVVFALPMLALCIFLYFAGAPLLRLIYGDAYIEGASVLFVMSLNLTLLALAFVFSRGLFALERADLDFRVNFVPLAVLFAAGVPLVRDHGIRGAAWALCLANGVALCCRLAAFLTARPREEVVTG